MLSGLVVLDTFQCFPDTCSSFRDSRKARIWKCTSDSWSFIHMDVPTGPPEEKRLGGIQIRYANRLNLLTQTQARKRWLHFRFPADV